MAKKKLPRMARLLRDGRARLGLNQHELAKRSGVARITIANVELGKHSGIRPSTAYKLAKALGITSDELLGETPDVSGEARGQRMTQVLNDYVALKKGTIVEPTAAETVWLQRVLEAWGDELHPSTASVLFLLLARRHGSV